MGAAIGEGGFDIDATGFGWGGEDLAEWREGLGGQGFERQAHAAAPAVSRR